MNNLQEKVNGKGIVSAEYTKEYKILVTFFDRTKKTIDFENILKEKINKGILQKEAIDKKVFLSFRISDFQLKWPSRYYDSQKRYVAPQSKYVVWFDCSYLYDL